MREVGVVHNTLWREDPYSHSINTPRVDLSMHTEAFVAHVQYDDYTGTAAADDADFKAATHWLSENGLSQNGEFLAGIEVFFGIVNLAGNRVASVSFFLAPSGGYDDTQKAIEEGAMPLVVRKVERELSMDDFFGLFKRFNVCISRNGLLNGKNVTYPNYG